ETTDYPFSDTIEFTVHTSRPVGFPFLVRIPGWTSEPTMELNGQPFKEIGAPGSFTTLERTFADGDRITLHLPMPMTVHRWANDTASIERGPLVYSLKIEENNTKVEDATTRPDFPAWAKRPASPWNFGLVLNGADSLRVVSGAMTGFP